MKKKKEKDLEVALDEITDDVSFSGFAVVEEEVKELAIQPLSVDFGREDLNTMGTKLNEVITFINKLKD